MQKVTACDLILKEETPTHTHTHRHTRTQMVHAPKDTCYQADTRTQKSHNCREITIKPNSPNHLNDLWGYHHIVA